ncbi:hypothetical protein [Solirubrobacter soli]|uniref:hypothetical protein n=1 Tax=Solirubrobacter soli TaxID=363832 RepID=UPI00041B5528|nr:hypothetical protein [Solirubrobacter soli]
MSLARNARNAVIADLAFAFARDRLAAQFPGVKPRKRGPNRKLLVLGGAAAAGAAVLLLKRDKVAALLPGRSESAPAPSDSGYTPPPVSNYDAAGPVANTATSVPVPPAQEPPTIDEAAEEAAAAAEAANIGGPTPDYAGPEGEPATPEELPLAEAGEGESEGVEQGDADLREAAEETGPTKQPGDDPEWRTWSGRSADS